MPLLSLNFEKQWLRFGTIRISPLALRGKATLLIHKSVHSSMKEASLSMCPGTIKGKVRVKLLTANVNRQHVELYSAVSGQGTHMTSADILLKAIQWGLQQCLMVTSLAEHGRAQIWPTNAGFGSTSATKNKQKNLSFNQVSTRCTVTQDEEDPNPTNQYHQVLKANIS